MSSLFLGFAFLLVAAVYAAAGFGGGSTYNALLVLGGIDYRSIPIIALSCNIIVVTGGIYHYSRGGHFSWRDLAPFAIPSIPMAWLGGRISVSETVFVGLLGLTLLLTAAFLLTKRLRQPSALSVVPRRDWQWGIPAGAGIGLVSGMVGVGGGIFLAPLLYLMRQGSPRRIAALASGFILLNSSAGLAGQLMKHGGSGSITLWSDNWLLFIAWWAASWAAEWERCICLKPGCARSPAFWCFMYPCACCSAGRTWSSAEPLRTEARALKR
jgi:uncharacterized membrane protein YfcA